MELVLFQQNNRVLDSTMKMIYGKVERHISRSYMIFSSEHKKYTMTVTWEKEEEEKMDVQGNIDKIKKYMERKSFSYSP